MISATISATSTAAQLEQVLQGLRAAAGSAAGWFAHEQYCELSKSDLQYELHFRAEAPQPGDRTGDIALKPTRSPCLSTLHCTVEWNGADQSFWEPISAAEMLERIDRFGAMFRGDYLQPPGWRGDKPGRERHPRFPRQRFLYQLTGPQVTVTGIGPQSFAGGSFGALRGQVLNATGAPLAGAQVEITCGGQTLTRTTNAKGEFWISNAPPGPAVLRVKGHVATVRIVETQCFGNVKATLTGAQGVLPGTGLELHSPDGEIFRATTDLLGRATTGPLPAFPYILHIPGFLFSATVQIVSDAEVCGTLLDERGAVLGGKAIVLSQNGSEVARQTTDAAGNFAFTGLRCGKFALSVPGYRLYVRSTAGATVSGKLTSAPGTVTLELVAQGQPIAAQAVPPGGPYRFSGLKPGAYGLRAKDHLLAKGGAA